VADPNGGQSLSSINYTIVRQSTYTPRNTVSSYLAFRQRQVPFSFALERSSRRKRAEPFRARTLVSRRGEAIS
jgi:hypothetical protein